MRRSAAGLLLLSAAVASAAAAACSGTEAAERPAGPPPMPVQIGEVRAQRLRETSEYVATLRSLRSVQVQPQVAGYLTRIVASSGDVVKPGSVLMQIDPSRQAAVVRSQEAAREANEASVAFWRRQAQRVQKLYGGGAATRMDLEQTQTSLKQAEASAAASKAQVHAQSIELRYNRVTAPAQGVVGDIPVRVGDYVTPQTLLTTLDDNAVLEVYVDVPLERASALRAGLPIEIIDGAGKTLAETEVYFISPRADAGSQTILVKAQIPLGTAGLRAGQFTRARVVWGERDGPAVPVLAIQNRNGQPFAWVVKQAHGGLHAEPRVVQVGPIQDQRYPVLRGLAPGEKIVLSGVQKLRPGAPVVALPPPGKTKSPSGGGG